MTTYKGRIDYCLQLKKEIINRAIEIIKLRISIAPNGYKPHYDPSDSFAMKGEFYENFEVFNDKLFLKINGYYPTALGLMEDIIPIEWLDMPDRELARTFLKMETDYFDTVKKREIKEKEERKSLYKELKEEFKDENI